MAIDTHAQDSEDFSLRESLEGLSQLLATWSDQRDAIRRTVQELSECAGSDPLSKIDPKPKGAENEEVVNFTNLMSDLGNVQNEAPCGTGRSEISVEFQGSDDGESSTSSSDFDFTVDEAWAARISQMEADIDEDSQISLVAIRLRRGEPEVLCRIDEVAEDEQCGSSSSSSAECLDEESSDGSRDSSVERMWAAVPEVGFPSGAAELPSAIPEPVFAAEVGGERKTHRPARRIVRKRKVHQPAQKGDSDGVDREKVYSTSAPPAKQLFEVPASFRLRSTSMGPKETGPLSEMQTRALDTE